jgi:hypothetical protein
MVLTIIFGLVFLDEIIMPLGWTDVFTRMSKSGTSSCNNKTAQCRLAGGGLLASTKYPLAFNAHGCVESGLGLVDDTAIIIIALPLSFLLLIVDVNTQLKREIPGYGNSASFLLLVPSRVSCVPAPTAFPRSLHREPCRLVPSTHLNKVEKEPLFLSVPFTAQMVQKMRRTFKISTEYD